MRAVMQDNKIICRTGVCKYRHMWRMLWTNWIQSIVLFGITVGILAYGICDHNRVYQECYVEAGVDITPQDFFRVPGVEASFARSSDVIDTKQPGEYHIVLQADGFSYRSILHIKDSIPPAGEAFRVELELGQQCAAAAFVKNITDATPVSVSYREEPDFSQTGEQQVAVVLTDLGGNKTVIDSGLYISKVLYELTVEAGSRPPGLADFVLEGEDAELLTYVQGCNYTQPADKIVYSRVDGKVYQTIMHIVDTVSPEVMVKNLSGYMLVPRKAEDFIASVQDVTQVTSEFVQEPDITRAGEQTVVIKVTDEGGNEVTASAKLTLRADTEAPRIEGVADLEVFRGSTILYKENVSVSDNCMEGLQLIVDNHAVNVDEAGIYPITYTARDLAGNETSASANVIVCETNYTEAEIYALADDVLAGIITEDMTQTEKAKAIYVYIKSHVAYIEHSEKGNWLNAAYEGLARQKGDCFVYASTAKALLTRAGIANMDIAKIPTRTNHYWNLVDVGDGWYHFDTTPRSDHPEIFLWTEAQLMEYSASHRGTHNYDHDLYPEVN